LIKKDKPLFEMAHTRTERMRKRMEKCAELDECPFCWENLVLPEYHDAPVIKKGEFWAITANDDPYKGIGFHFLAIYRDHVSSISEIAPGAGDELFKFFSELCKEYGMVGATILMRSGEMKYTGATVSHLHAQIMSGASLDEVPESLLDELTRKPKFPDAYIISVLGYKVPELK
jgi:diadenosine tetraphosphate (Ap4A) HIT family hydrolase